MTTKTMDIISIQAVKNHAEGHFFDAGATHFFSSRYPQDAYKVGNKAYFVTSEQFDYKSPRLYTVRVCDFTTGEVDTVGKFQEYATRKQALAAIKKLVES